MEWIKTKDKLPENYRPVLFFKAKSLESPKIASLRLGVWTMQLGEHQVIIEGVTHWMPLPEPPSNKD